MHMKNFPRLLTFFPLIALFSLTLLGCDLLPRDFGEVQVKRDIWNEFVKEPNLANYQAIICEIKSVDDKGSLIAKEPSVLIGEESGWFLRSLYGQVRIGDYYSCRLAFKLYYYFNNNVAFIESLNNVLGEIINVNPNLFLELINAYPLDSARHFRLQSIVLATGDIYVDRPGARIIENDRRIKSLKGVESGTYLKERDQCIAILEKKNHHLRKIINSGVLGDVNEK
ncbi:hypothetical protein Dalk_0858 [Desulfatibacillum aliphaticivorans]|uniref:Lipoprotein n=1 Tax=Desulfatibacillum aliphaticivorans TaxID=218208 RepID=B8FHZ6_DESAL|nr:hypothetical protein [Desulfatibacillum aliphaticivorans]ACL02563.1 hypothetical protein Dalk_0858 [Desulfatibacillum aliphaticivorans]